MSDINKPDKLSDEDKELLVSSVESEISTSLKWGVSEVQSQNAESMKYYYGSLPAQDKAGLSTYVSRDVFNGVENTIVPLIEMFTVNQQIAKFDVADTLTNPKLMSLATDEVNRVLMQANDGYNIFSSWFRDALLAKNGIVKSYWHEQFDTVLEEFEDLNDAELEHLLSEEDIDERSVAFTRREISRDNDILGIVATVTVVSISGSVNRMVDNSGVKVENVPPEEFIVAEMTRDIKKPHFVAHRMKKTLAEMRVMFPDDEFQDLIDGMTNRSEAEWEELLIERHAVDSTYMETESYTGNDPEQRETWVYECYLESTFGSEDGSSRLIQLWTDGYIFFGMEEVDEAPFSVVCPYPIAHKFYGLSLADVLKDIQDTKSHLQRSVLNAARNVSAPRYTGMKGRYDRKALLANKPGTVIDVRDPQAVMPLIAPQLPPQVMESLAMIDQDKQERTGMSKAANGIDSDLMKNNKSGAFVDTVINQGEKRMRGIGRNFAYTGFSDLMERVYNLVRLNDRVVREDVENGPWSPAEWPEKHSVTVSVALGRNAQTEEMQWKMQILQMAKDNGMATPETEVAYFKDILRLGGEMDVDKFQATAEAVVAHQEAMMRKEMEIKKELEHTPSPMELHQMKMEEITRETEAKLAEVEMLNAQSRQEEAAIRRAEAETKQMDAENEHERGMLKLQIDSAKQQADAEIGFSELEMDGAKTTAEIEKMTEERMSVAQESAAEGAGSAQDAFNEIGEQPIIL
jgi:hypothetical protein